MAEDIRLLIKKDEVVDITTLGRKTGAARRIEIRLHALDGRLYITGRPGRPRSWYANMLASPEFTLHLKHNFVRDVACEAIPIVEEKTRRRLFEMMLSQEESMAHVVLDEWAILAPLVEVVPTD
ncbi:MAG: nitroreductase/quinone reductase family protein [Chloroflexota bacterium]|nr:nitroreductase/quinone reductase family protein [Chloroflexota bacterium]